MCCVGVYLIWYTINCHKMYDGGADKHVHCVIETRVLSNMTIVKYLKKSEIENRLKINQKTNTYADCIAETDIC